MMPTMARSRGRKAAAADAERCVDMQEQKSIAKTKDMQKYLSYLTAIVAIAAFLFSVYQYVDTRFEHYHRVFESVAGQTAKGVILVNTQQAMAVYELSEFSEYRDLSLPIINYYLNQTEGEADDSLFREALLYAKDTLSQ